MKTKCPACQSELEAGIIYRDGMPVKVTLEKALYKESHHEMAEPLPVPEDKPKPIEKFDYDYNGISITPEEALFKKIMAKIDIVIDAINEMRK